jgi:hypothetical protein
MIFMGVTGGRTGGRIARAAELQGMQKGKRCCGKPLTYWIGK